MRFFLIVFALGFVSGCSNRQAELSRYSLSNEDVHLLLNSIDIPIVDNYSVHVIIKEFLNDSSFIIHVQQHGFGSKGNEFENEFYYRGMKVFIYPKMLNYWVPDSFHKRFLIRYRKGIMLLDSLPDYTINLWHEYSEQDPIDPILEKENF
jgi:hypothetical protein